MHAGDGGASAQTDVCAMVHRGRSGRRRRAGLIAVLARRYGFRGLALDRAAYPHSVRLLRLYASRARRSPQPRRRDCLRAAHPPPGRGSGLLSPLPSCPAGPAGCSLSGLAALVLSLIALTGPSPGATPAARLSSSSPSCSPWPSSRTPTLAGHARPVLFGLAPRNVGGARRAAWARRRAAWGRPPASAPPANARRPPSPAGRATAPGRCRHRTGDRAGAVHPAFSSTWPSPAVSRRVNRARHARPSRRSPLPRRGTARGSRGLWRWTPRQRHQSATIAAACSPGCTRPPPRCCCGFVRARLVGGMIRPDRRTRTVRDRRVTLSASRWIVGPITLTHELVCCRGADPGGRGCGGICRLRRGCRLGRGIRAGVRAGRVLTNALSSSLRV